MSDSTLAQRQWRDKGIRHHPFKPASHARLLEVAERRLAGQQWKQIAAEMGWRSRQAAEHWAKNNVRRWERDSHDR